jgi:hypothetical protein
MVDAATDQPMSGATHRATARAFAVRAARSGHRRSGSHFEGHDEMPRMLRRAAVLGAKAHVASKRGEARGAEAGRDVIAEAGGIPVSDSWVHPLDLVEIGIAASERG